MPRITLNHRVPGEQIALGLMRVERADFGPASPALREAIAAAVAEAEPISEQNETRRKLSRDMLRNGRYKPTGRGKPASEYLLRAAKGGVAAFPAINHAVDAINLASLRYLAPISLWDLERAAARAYEVRLGRADERYVFNPTGQTLELEDLVCGCALEGEASRPIVTPIKDCQATKTDETSRRVGVIIYYPRQAGPGLQAMLDELKGWLGEGEGETAVAILEPSGSVEL